MEKKVTSSVSSCSALNSPGAPVHAQICHPWSFSWILLVVIMQLINFGAIIPINTSRVQMNYPDAT